MADRVIRAFGLKPDEKQEKEYRFGKGQEKGRIVFLNGVTSSGKTSIVDALQAAEYSAGRPL